MRKPDFHIYAKTKVRISCAVTAQLISTSVFPTWIVQSFFFYSPSVTVQAGLCRPSLETLKTIFLSSWICKACKNLPSCHLHTVTLCSSPTDTTYFPVHEKSTEHIPLECSPLSMDSVSLVTAFQMCTLGGLPI